MYNAVIEPSIFYLDLEEIYKVDERDTSKPAKALFVVFWSRYSNLNNELIQICHSNGIIISMERRHIILEGRCSQRVGHYQRGQ